MPTSPLSQESMRRISQLQAILRQIHEKSMGFTPLSPSATTNFVRRLNRLKHSVPDEFILEVKLIFQNLLNDKKRPNVTLINSILKNLLKHDTEMTFPIAHLIHRFVKLRHLYDRKTLIHMLMLSGKYQDIQSVVHIHEECVKYINDSQSITDEGRIIFLMNVNMRLFYFALKSADEALSKKLVSANLTQYMKAPSHPSLLKNMYNMYEIAVSANHVEFTRQLFFELIQAETIRPQLYVRMIECLLRNHQFSEARSIFCAVEQEKEVIDHPRFTALRKTLFPISAHVSSIGTHAHGFGIFTRPTASMMNDSSHETNDDLYSESRLSRYLGRSSCSA